MNQNEQELLKDLRALADADPREAPAAVRERSLVEFRRRSAQQRRMGWLPAAGVGAIAAATLIFFLVPKQVPTHGTDAPTAISNAAIQPSSANADETDGGFYPLPEAEGLPPIETATVIRVQMPVESLQLMGVAVSDAGSAEPVQADILLGQDGLARGVRLVQ